MSLKLEMSSLFSADADDMPPAHQTAVDSWAIKNRTMVTIEAAGKVMINPQKGRLHYTGYGGILKLIIFNY